jgi:hypothetical protein
VCILDVYFDIMLLQRLGVIGIALVLIYSLYRKKFGTLKSAFKDIHLKVVLKMSLKLYF